MAISVLLIHSPCKKNILTIQWIRVLARILWVAVHWQTWSQKAFSSRGVWGHASPPQEIVQIWSVFGAFSMIFSCLIWCIGWTWMIMRSLFWQKAKINSKQPISYAPVTVRHRCAHVCPQVSFYFTHVHVSCEITHYICRGFQKDGCLEHIAFLSLFSHGYPLRVFCKVVWLVVSMMRLLHTKCVSLEREKCPFSYLLRKPWWIRITPEIRN